jgi:hypothetical protein
LISIKPSGGYIGNGLEATCWILVVIMNDINQESFKTVRIADLVPTQVTVGMREVNFKRRRWREKHSHQAANYLNTHRLPVVLGPDARHYLIDRHHLALALNDEGMIWELPVSIVANMGELSFDRFWTTLESHNWTHPFDDEGRRYPYDRRHAQVSERPHRRSLSLIGRGAQNGWWIRQGQSAFQ